MVSKARQGRHREPRPVAALAGLGRLGLELVPDALPGLDASGYHEPTVKRPEA